MILWIALIARAGLPDREPDGAARGLELPGAGDRPPHAANYVEAYGRARHLQALWNTLQFGAGVAALSCLFGVPLAWAISRTDMPAKGFIRLMVFGAFIIPPYLGAIGWILLAGPNAGWLNKVWMALTGAESGMFNVYSMAGLIVVIAVTSFPYVFVFTSARSISSPPRWRTPRTFWAPARCAPRSASRCRWCCRRSSAD